MVLGSTRESRTLPETFLETLQDILGCFFFLCMGWLVGLAAPFSTVNHSKEGVLSAHYNGMCPIEQKCIIRYNGKKAKQSKADNNHSPLTSRDVPLPGGGAFLAAITTRPLMQLRGPYASLGGSAGPRRSPRPHYSGWKETFGGCYCNGKWHAKDGENTAFGAGKHA